MKGMGDIELPSAKNIGEKISDDIDKALFTLLNEKVGRGWQRSHVRAEMFDSKDPLDFLHELIYYDGRLIGDISCTGQIIQTGNRVNLKYTIVTREIG